MTSNTAKPNWDNLYDIAVIQDGHFTTQQATHAGFSPQLLAKYLKSGRIRRIRRCIYRIVHYPAGEHENLVVLWLWSERAGVFSHETSLTLLELSDVLPACVHITLPVSWKVRRLRVPRGLFLHYADLADDERTWFGSVPVTTATRTLTDCMNSNMTPDLVRHAFEQAIDRGLVDPDSLPGVIDYLKKFYSVSRSKYGPRFRSAYRRTQKQS